MTTTTAPAAVAVASEGYAAFGRGDIPAFLDLLADNVAWDDFPSSEAARGGVSYLQPRTDVQGVGEFFADIARFTFNRFDIHSIVGDDRTAYARISVEAETPTGGAFADEEIHMWVLGEDGRVVQFRHYVDTAKHLAALRGEDTRR